jgi:2-dehydropantoate 2-reductase
LHAAFSALGHDPRMIALPNPLRDAPIAIIGAGAVGCYYGALLARAGLNVTLIGRPAAVAALRDRGLQLLSGEARSTFRVHADEDTRAAAAARLVLICVKSSDTGLAAASLRPHLGADTLVLSLQNGVTNAESLLATLDQPVVAAAVYVAAALEAPGTVRHFGGGALTIGAPATRPVSAPETAALAALLNGAGIETTVTPDITSVLWGKLVVNCAYNALSAITQQTYGQLVASSAIRRVMHDAIDEVLEVAKARSIALPGDMHERVMKVAGLMPGQRSSTAQDLARRRPTEIDYLNGYIAAEGARLGLATPVNQTLGALVRQLESTHLPAEARSSAAT